MPIELQIIRAQEFIRVGAHGHFDLEASQAVLKQLATACRKRGIHQALLDVRALQPGAKPVFSPKDLVALVETFDQVGFKREDRVAVLYGSDPHHRASLFSFAATVHGWQVQAFKDFERAVFWLAAAEPESATAPETQTTSRPKRVPVRQLKSLRRPPKPAAQPVIQIKSTSGAGSAAAPVRLGKIKPCTPTTAATSKRA
jgi:hypothetical protein